MRLVHYPISDRIPNIDPRFADRLLPDDCCRDYHCNHRLGLFYGGFATGVDALG